MFDNENAWEEWFEKSKREEEVKTSKTFDWKATADFRSCRLYLTTDGEIYFEVVLAKRSTFDAILWTYGTQAWISAGCVDIIDAMECAKQRAYELGLLRGGDQVRKPWDIRANPPLGEDEKARLFALIEKKLGAGE